MDKSKMPPKPREISLRWKMNWEWHRPRRYSILGLAESGKSALNEYLAAHHPKIVDIFGSRDNENLSWLRESSPVENPLLVCGDNTELECRFPWKHVSELTMADIDAHDATVTCDAFYSSQEVKFASIQKICDLFYNRHSWDKAGGDIIYLVIREAMSLLYSKISLGEGEKEAKAAILTFLRELRHFGVSFGADTLRWTGIEKEIRDLADYTFFKQIGEVGLPRDKRYIYNYVEPRTFAHMKPWESIALHKTGTLTYIHTPCPKWHKEEGVNLIAELGIKITHTEGASDSTAAKVGDKEHSKMIELFSAGNTYRMVAAQVSRSTSTCGDAIRIHNESIRQHGECLACVRANSDLSKVPIVQPTRRGETSSLVRPRDVSSSSKSESTERPPASFTPDSGSF
jgi:hypothetical protein